MREVAKRVFAREYAESDLVVRDGNTEYAPSYVVTPTGAKCNRLYISGVLTEIEKVGDDESYRARISDPTGQFLVFAGEYQPEAAKFFSDAEVPSFVSIYGKTNVYRPDEETVITSIRPESINYCKEIDRDRWIVKTARLTLKRLQNIDQKTLEHYTPDKQQYKKLVQEALEITIGQKPTQKKEPETKKPPIKPKKPDKSKETEEKTEKPIENDFETKTQKQPKEEKPKEEVENQKPSDEDNEDDFLEEIISGEKKEKENKEDKEDSGEKGIEEWDLSGS
ncbi:hypothetical protein [Methanonatronarchaeum sp. AMET-Sl]|uniref:hypothetical protein n=1 Tax=Methanonatronarchaeum sp. AMET-Sl TaxID=3037654 RepID=UPI00244E5222|nr:hypothetical protein [Methanonatronarchaeum sp. AMET-Sl]WGI17084.1 hypothetical protein QEN48_06180 [Methanonatronarchaeum sp. AMET-Sl]